MKRMVPRISDELCGSPFSCELTSKGYQTPANEQPLRTGGRDQNKQQ